MPFSILVIFTRTVAYWSEIQQSQVRTWQICHILGGGENVNTKMRFVRTSVNERVASQRSRLIAEHERRRKCVGV